jgi:hypothetical protein
MGLKSVPQSVRDRFLIDERGHASAILASDYPHEFKDIMECLDGFVLRKSHILTPGGGRSPISTALDNFLQMRGWKERRSEELFFSEKNYSALRHGELNSC